MSGLVLRSLDILKRLSVLRVLPVTSSQKKHPISPPAALPSPYTLVATSSRYPGCAFQLSRTEISPRFSSPGVATLTNTLLVKQGIAKSADDGNSVTTRETAYAGGQDSNRVIAAEAALNVLNGPQRPEPPPQHQLPSPIDSPSRSHKPAELRGRGPRAAQCSDTSSQQSWKRMGSAQALARRWRLLSSGRTRYEPTNCVARTAPYNTSRWWRRTCWTGHVAGISCRRRCTTRSLRGP